MRGENYIKKRGLQLMNPYGTLDTSDLNCNFIMTKNKEKNAPKDLRKVKSAEDAKTECQDCPGESSQGEGNADYIQDTQRLGEEVWVGIAGW